MAATAGISTAVKRRQSCVIDGLFRRRRMRILLRQSPREEMKYEIPTKNDCHGRDRAEYLSIRSKTLVCTASSHGSANRLLPANAQAQSAQRYCPSRTGRCAHSQGARNRRPELL
jgi:hypothetical protein